MTALIPIVLCMILGGLLGYIAQKQKTLLKLADTLAIGAVYFLLFVLGANLGAKPELFARLPELGFAALVLALCCSAGSVLVVYFAEHFFVSKASTATSQDSQNSSPPLWGTVRILSCFALGVILSRFDILPLWICNGKLAEYAIWILIFMVGIGLGSELKVFATLQSMKYTILLIPILIVLGTGLGAMGAFLILPQYSVKDVLSVGAGFGYYSLSSIIISDSGNAALASVALLSNILRELLGLISAPILSRYIGPLSPIAVAGATAMDTCLPVIARFSGERFAIIAVFSGVVLTVLVPFLVSFILAW